MMEQDQASSEQGIVAILRRSNGASSTDADDMLGAGRHVGMGILLTDRIALTCAHVVNSALGKPVRHTEAPADSEWIDLAFPIVAGTHIRKARVLDWSPPGKDGLDCAVLELEEPAPPDAGRTMLAVVRPEDSEGNELSVYGSLAPNHPGAHLSAQLLGEVGARWSQLDVKGRFGIQPGFSGGAVWNRQQRASVGMVVARETGKGGITGYFLPAERIVARFGQFFPSELRETRLKRQISFSAISVLLFALMLIHYLANRGDAALVLVPWATRSKDLAAFFGAHCFAVFLGPYVMWHVQQHARSFALRKWWRRVPTLLAGQTAAMLDNTRLGALMTVLFLVFLPAYAQGVFLDKLFFEERRIVVNVNRFDGLSEQDCIWKVPDDQKWCTVDGVGVWSFRAESPYFNHAYQIVGTCTQEGRCQMVTFFPFLQPAILFTATAFAYLWFFMFLYALIRPWPYRFETLWQGSLSLFSLTKPMQRHSRIAEKHE